jgi:hypothetical protein
MTEVKDAKAAENLLFRISVFNHVLSIHNLKLVLRI